VLSLGVYNGLEVKALRILFRHHRGVLSLGGYIELEVKALRILFRHERGVLSRGNIGLEVKALQQDLGLSLYDKIFYRVRLYH
jgi:hypothetical protein